MISDPVKPKQGANFPIEPYIVLELQDADGRRIYSGRDSNLVKSLIDFCKCSEFQKQTTGKQKEF